MNMDLFKEMASKSNGKSIIDACLKEIESLRQQQRILNSCAHTTKSWIRNWRQHDSL